MTGRVCVIARPCHADVLARRGSFEGERACKAVIYDPTTKCGPDGFVEGEADSPALALALALIAALEGGA